MPGCIPLRRVVHRLTAGASAPMRSDGSGGSAEWSGKGPRLLVVAIRTATRAGKLRRSGDMLIALRAKIVGLGSSHEQIAEYD